MTKLCGSCTLCCTLVPVGEIGKPANHDCEHQRRNGCAIYKDRPLSCRKWNCAWLRDDDVAGLPRPDKAGYVIDTYLDEVTVGGNADGIDRQIACVQIWCDPKRPDAWRTPELKAFIERRGEEGMGTMIRYANVNSIIVLPPTFFVNGGPWMEFEGPPGVRIPNSSRRESHA